MREAPADSLRDFVEQGENVLLEGGSGLGKTMIAQNLAHAALAGGFTVRFSTLAAALADLLNKESIPAFERRIRRYTRPDVLILDELGYLPCDTRAADILYNIISRRHEQRSTIITTNLAFKQWGNTFPGAACVVALIDCFAQRCHHLEIIGDSHRDKHRLDPDPTEAHFDEVTSQALVVSSTSDHDGNVPPLTAPRCGTPDIARRPDEVGARSTDVTVSCAGAGNRRRARSILRMTGFGSKPTLSHARPCST